MPPDFAALGEFPEHVGRVVREAVTVAAMEANRDRDEALAEAIGREVAREWWEVLRTRRLPAPGVRELARGGDGR